MLELTVRLIASLAIVVGLLLLIAKVGGRRMRGRSGSLVQVVHRQPLSRSSAVAVVTVGSRVLVLGTTEQHVSVLTELEADELDVLPGTGADLVLVPGETDELGEPTEIPVLLPAVPVTHEAPAAPGRRAGGARRAAPARAGSRAARSGGARRAEVAKKAPKQAAAQSGARRAAPAHVPTNGPLAGSVLSPDTWKQALAAAMGKAS